MENITTVESFLKVICTPGQLIKFIDLVPDLEFSSLDYVGFDYMKLLDRIVQIKTSKAISEDEFSRDMQTCVAIGMKRGNIRKAGAKKIADLVLRYGIKQKPTRGSKSSTLSPTDLTFVRFVSVLPGLASTMIFRNPDDFKNSQLSGIYGSKYLPDVLKHSGAAALIPKSDIGNMFLVLYTGYMMELSLLINPSCQKTPVEELFQTQKRFSDAANNSTMYDNKERVGWFKTFELNTDKALKIVVEGFNIIQKARGKAMVAFENLADYFSGNLVVFIDAETDKRIQAVAIAKGQSKTTDASSSVAPTTFLMPEKKIRAVDWSST